jgi:phosphatidylglycerophosphate synthase
MAAWPRTAVSITAGPRTAAPRRGLATRDAAWARALARRMAAAGVRPNAVSLAGLGFALASAGVFCLSPHYAPGARTGLLLAAAACIQLRLLCNLLDGMLAVEEGLRSRTGEIFNELPDRLADVLILVGAGYAAPSTYTVTLGWAAAVTAVFTAYVRVLGGSLGLSQHFIGPMAKQHRMFTLTLATIAAAVEATLGLPARALGIGLAVVAAGSTLTIIRRVARLLAEADLR